MESIKVTVVEFGDRKFYQLQWRDPNTGRKKTKSSEVERPAGNASKRTIEQAIRLAERAAESHEKALIESGGALPGRINWEDFRERYEREHLESLAENTYIKACVAFGKIETILRPLKLSDLTAQRLSYFQSKLRDSGLAESSIKSVLYQLRAALSWAKEQGLLATLPAITIPRRAKTAKSMKGRPITLEEFERMLAKTETIVGPERAESWKHYLRGLYLSGLRLAESLNLYWDRHDMLCIELEGNRPLLWIPGPLHKRGVDTLAPVAPEFAEFLLSTSEDKRTGRVFNPAPERKHGDRMSDQQVSKIISRIGKAAGVKVDQKGDKVKYASAHDLRRSFGERWSSRVMPQVLQELMRHEQIETTLRFYVGRNAQRTADVLWAAHEAATEASNTSSNTGKARGKKTLKNKLGN